MPETEQKEKRDRSKRAQEPYYHPKDWTLKELEAKIGARGSVGRKKFKRNLVIMWLRIKTELPFKPHLWALPSPRAREFYNDRTDRLWKDWAEKHPAPAPGTKAKTHRSTGVKAVRTKVQAPAEDKASPFETTLVVKRAQLI